MKYDDSPTETPTDAIDDMLKAKYKKGRMSAREVQAEAATIYAAVPSSSSSASSSGQRWAAAGAEGRHPGNASRDITLQMSKTSTNAHVYSASIPFWDPVRSVQIQDDAYLLVPHEVGDKAMEDGQDWSSLPQGHSLNRTLSDWKEKNEVEGDDDIAVVGLWADSATYHTRDSLYLILFNFLSGINRMRFWVSAWSKRHMCACGCKGRHTFDAMQEVVNWSMLAWMSGRYPTVRHDGVAFEDSKRPNDKLRARWGAGRRLMQKRAVVLQQRGDWAILKSIYNLCGWTPEGPSGRVCWKCMANTTDHPFTDVSLSASWRATRVTHEIFMHLNILNSLHVSPIFDLPGFRLEHVSSDLMHCVCLGIVQYCLGTIIFEVCFGPEMKGLITRPGPVLGEFMALLRLASHQLDIACPIGDLTIGMVRKKSGPPKLKTKAAEGRHLVPVVVWVLQNCFKVEEGHTETRLRCLQNLQWMYEAMAVPASEWDAKATAKYCRRHIMLWAELGLESLQALGHQQTGWVMYRFYPKHHLTLHCVEDQVEVSGCPRESWCYMDESAIGDAVHVAEAVHSSTLHRAVIERHRL